jgi:hypothetical protein
MPLPIPDPYEYPRMATLAEAQSIAEDAAGRVAAAVRTELRTDLQAVVTRLDERLDTHEQTAAAAAEQARGRDEVLSGRLTEVVEALARLEQAVVALAGRVEPLETEAERDKWRAEGAREAMTGVRPSPLVVIPPAPAAPEPPPATKWLYQWTPTHLLIALAIISAMATGTAIPWERLLTVGAPPPVGGP